MTVIRTDPTLSTRTVQSPSKQRRTAQTRQNPLSTTVGCRHTLNPSTPEKGRRHPHQTAEPNQCIPAGAFRQHILPFKSAEDQHEAKPEQRHDGRIETCS